MRKKHQLSRPGNEHPDLRNGLIFPPTDEEPRALDEVATEMLMAPLSLLSIDAIRARKMDQAVPARGFLSTHPHALKKRVGERQPFAK